MKFIKFSELALWVGCLPRITQTRHGTTHLKIPAIRVEGRGLHVQGHPWLYNALRPDWATKAKERMRERNKETKRKREEGSKQARKEGRIDYAW